MARTGTRHVREGERRRPVLIAGRAPRWAVPSPLVLHHFFFAAFLFATAVLKTAPAVKRGTVDAAILISAPVCGLRPVRAARLDDLKVPKPTRVTVSPFATALTTASRIASSALPAAALLMSASVAATTINSHLFINIPSLVERTKYYKHSGFLGLSAHNFPLVRHTKGQVQTTPFLKNGHFAVFASNARGRVRPIPAWPQFFLLCSRPGACAYPPLVFLSLFRWFFCFGCVVFVCF